MYLDITDKVKSVVLFQSKDGTLYLGVDDFYLIFPDEFIAFLKPKWGIDIKSHPDFVFKNLDWSIKYEHKEK